MAKKAKRIYERVIPIETTEESFFHEYVSIMRPFINAQVANIMKRDGTDKESDVANGKKLNQCFYALAEGDQAKIFAMMLYFNDKYSDLSDEERVKMLKDNDIHLRIKQKVYDKIVVRNTNFYKNYIQALRNMRCLVDKATEDKKMINPLFEIFPSNKIRIIFEFDIKDRSRQL